MAYSRFCRAYHGLQQSFHLAIHCDLSVCLKTISPTNYEINGTNYEISGTNFIIDAINFLFDAIKSIFDGTIML